MITQATLQVIKATYTPEHIKKSGAIVEENVLKHQEFLEKALRCGLNSKGISAFTFDIKVALESLVGNPLSEMPIKCFLYFDENIQDDLHLTFVYLHELGHIDWKLNDFDKIVSTHAEREYYADLYAYEILRGHYKEEIADKWLRALGSAGGWYNKENDREELLEFWKRNRKTWRVKRL